MRGFPRLFNLYDYDRGVSESQLAASLVAAAVASFTLFEAVAYLIREDPQSRAELWSSTIEAVAS